MTTPSAPITLQCPGCKTSLKFKGDVAGRRLKCPRCGLSFPGPQVAAGGAAPSAKPRAAWRDKEAAIKAKIQSLDAIGKEVCFLYVVRSLLEPDFPRDPNRDLLGIYGQVLRSRGHKTDDRAAMGAIGADCVRQSVDILAIAIGILEIAPEKMEDEGQVDQRVWLPALGLAPPAGW